MDRQGPYGQNFTLGTRMADSALYCRVSHTDVDRPPSEGSCGAGFTKTLGLVHAITARTEIHPESTPVLTEPNECGILYIGR